MKKKKYYVGVFRYLFYGFLGLEIIYIIFGLVGIILNYNNLLVFILLAFVFGLILIYFANIGFNWVEIDQIGIHAKKLWWHIESIRWENIKIIEERTIVKNRFVENAIVVKSNTCIDSEINDYFNKGDGIIKVAKSKKVEDEIKKYYEREILVFK